MTDPERKPDPPLVAATGPAPATPAATAPPLRPAAGPGLVGLLDQSARDALAGLERNLTRGFEGANAALTTPEGADLAPLLAATDLPELPPEGPLGKVGIRLDREADLLRNIALRELARIGWLERLAIVVIAAVVVGEVLIAASATFSALAGASDGRGGLFALAATILAGAGAGTAAIVARSRAAHRALAEEALGRSREVEARIFRLGLVMEWRLAGPALYQDALARLERDAFAPARDPSAMS